MDKLNPSFQGMKFVYSYEDRKTIVSMGPHQTLPELLIQFEQFLKGCGYHFDGEIDIVPIDEGEIIND